MRYLVDQALCCGHGQCAAHAPDVYSLDDDGFNQAVGRFAEVEPGLEQAARTGASSCPEAAIRLFDNHAKDPADTPQPTSPAPGSSIHPNMDTSPAAEEGSGH